MIDWTYSPSRTPVEKINRRLTQWRAAAPVVSRPEKLIVSFTFDDFPKSALNGADIIETFGGKAGFYACTQFLGRTSPMGEMYDTQTLRELTDREHEIGAHSHSHLDCAKVTPEAASQDMEDCVRRLQDLGVNGPISSMAYPYGETTFSIKQSMTSMFDIGRGILPGQNVGRIDRMQLRAYQLNDHPLTVERAFNALNAAIANGSSWLIFFSHDVDRDHTKYGVHPDTIRGLCHKAVDAGAVLAAPYAAAQMCGVIS